MQTIKNILIAQSKLVYRSLLRLADRAMKGVIARYHVKTNEVKIRVLDSSTIERRIEVRYDPVYKYFEDLKSSLYRLMPKNSLAQDVLAQEDIRSCVFSFLRPDDFKKTRLYSIYNIQGYLVTEELGDNSHRLPDFPKNYCSIVQPNLNSGRVVPSEYLHHLQTHIIRLMPPKSTSEKVFEHSALKDKIFSFISVSDMMPVLDGWRMGHQYPHGLTYEQTCEQRLAFLDWIREHAPDILSQTTQQGVTISNNPQM